MKGSQGERRPAKEILDPRRTAEIPDAGLGGRRNLEIGRLRYLISVALSAISKPTHRAMVRPSRTLKSRATRFTGNVRIDAERLS